MTLRAVKTLSDDLAALGLPEAIVARARAYEADALAVMRDLLGRWS